MAATAHLDLPRAAATAHLPAARGRRRQEGGDALVAERVERKTNNLQRGKLSQGRREGTQARVADGGVEQFEDPEPRQGAAAQRRRRAPRSLPALPTGITLRARSVRTGSLPMPSFAISCTMPSGIAASDLASLRRRCAREAAAAQHPETTSTDQRAQRRQVGRTARPLRLPWTSVASRSSLQLRECTMDNLVHSAAWPPGVISLQLLPAAAPAPDSAPTARGWRY